MPIGVNNPVYIHGEDGAFHKLGVVSSIDITPNDDFDNPVDYLVERRFEGEFEIKQDLCIRRLLSTLIDERLGSNNWRKHHGLPMWRLR